MPPALASWKETYDSMLGQIRQRESKRPDCATVIQLVARSGPALDYIQRSGRRYQDLAPAIQENLQYAEALPIVDDGCR